jgi:hypothetical protein
LKNYSHRVMDRKLRNARGAGKEVSMKLSAENVHKIFQDCLFKKEENHEDNIRVEGITCNFGFHPGRLKSNKDKISELVYQLPKEFRKSSEAGGHSFLNACVDGDGQQWGEHRNVEQLMVLGVAIGKIEYLVPKEMWGILPGGVPYFRVND